MKSVTSVLIHRENGPLRNGNRRGNPNLAPRCSATTKQGRPCGSPAMKNGKCRMHGGPSTGPKTEAGKAAIVAASTKHGYRGEFGRLFAKLRQTVVSRVRQIRDTPASTQRHP